MLLGRLNAETSKNTNSRRDSFEHAWDCQRPGQSQVKSNASPMNHKCIMMGIFNRKVPNWVEVSIWSESIWYNHQFLDGWHWYALKIWLKNNKTPQASSCSACFMVPLRFWLWDPLLGICKSTSINHCGMLISWIFWIFLGIPTNHLWIPANFKCHLDTTQKQSFRKSHDRPALVSWATLVWNSRRISRMSKSCSYTTLPSSLNWSTLCQTIMFQTCMSVAWELKLIFHELFSEFSFQRCHAICPIASPFIFES